MNLTTPDDFVCIRKKIDVKGHFRFKDSCYKAKKDDLVWLVPEPDNPYDENAIMVWNAEGETLGYVPKRRNRAFFLLLTGDYPHYSARIRKIKFCEDDGLPMPEVEVFFAKNESALPFLIDDRFVSKTIIEITNDGALKAKKTDVSDNNYTQISFDGDLSNLLVVIIVAFCLIGYLLLNDIIR